MKLYEVEVWTQPEESCYVRVTLACGSVWLIPLAPLIDLTQRYYEPDGNGHGWYDPDEVGRGKDCVARRQPRGKKLRAIMAANIDPEQWAKEADWQKIREHAIHVSGTGEPPDDELWAVEESGGTFDFVTTLPSEEQRKSGRVLYSDTDPEKWPELVYYDHRTEARKKDEVPA